MTIVEHHLVSDGRKPLEIISENGKLDYVLADGDLTPGGEPTILPIRDKIVIFSAFPSSNAQILQVRGHFCLTFT